MARVCIVSEVRFVRSESGTICCANGSRAYEFWARYLAAFDSVTVIARVADAAAGEGHPVVGRAVTVHAIEDYRGVYEYARQRKSVKEAIVRAARADACWILRLPGQLGNLAATALRSTSSPVGVELVGDPADVFASGVMRHPLRPALRWWFTAQTRRICRSTHAVAYVTEHALQRRYPAGPSAYTTAYSSVELPPEAFATSPRDAPATGRPITIVGVGGLHQLYKGADVLLEAVRQCRVSGSDFRLEWVGGGRHLEQLARTAAQAGLTDVVSFHGNVPAGPAVREILDRADLFVLPSRTEGLPRALLEAMARALPCVASRVGGIPELLPDEFLVPAGDPAAMATTLVRVTADAELLRRASAQNLARARDFRSEILTERRTQFYHYLATRCAKHA